MTERKAADMDGILDIALESGTLILQSGGETYRTEETMMTIAESLGASDASAFVTPTVAILTCVDSEGRSHTKLQRIISRTINLGTIARVNELSRRIEGRQPDNDLSLISALLGRIRSIPERPAFAVSLATAIASFCFSLMFRGTLNEAFTAAAVGIIMRLFLFLMVPLALSGFIYNAIGGAVISLLSGLAVMLGLVGTGGNVSISVLMSLVPGLAIVNAIRDIIAGDLVAGSARLLEAFVIAAALSLGAAFGLLVFPVGGAYASVLGFHQSLILSFMLSTLAAGSFAYFFHINKYDIIWTSLAGGFGWVTFLLLQRSQETPIAAYLAGALCVGIISELFAIIFRKPATVYIVSGIIPFVPGGGMYETMLYSTLGNMEAAARTGFQTLSAAAAIAVGIAVASSISRLLARLVKSRNLQTRRP